MERIKRFTKKHLGVLLCLVVVALVPILATGCSLGGGSSPTPTPSTQSTTSQIYANISRIDTSLGSITTRLTSVEGQLGGIASIQTRMTAVENMVSGLNISAIQTCLTTLQGQIAQLQADLTLANSRIATLATQVNSSLTPTPTPTPTGATPTPTVAPIGSGLVVTVTPLFSGAVKDLKTYDYTFSVKNNYTTAKTFVLVVDYLANTNSANVNITSTELTSAEVISGFTTLFSPSTGHGCGLIRFTSSSLVIPAGGTLNINATFDLVYNTGSPTTVWICSVTTQ